jgi:hypothetical protein
MRVAGQFDIVGAALRREKIATTLLSFFSRGKPAPTSNAGKLTYCGREWKLAERRFRGIATGTMTTLKKPVFAILLASLGAILGGCATNGPKKSAIPWSQPANWEGQIPGMGQPMGR